MSKKTVKRKKKDSEIGFLLLSCTDTRPRDNEKLRIINKNQRLSLRGKDFFG